MKDPFEREIAVFGAARRLSETERAAYLDQACAGDAALRRRVEELLKAGDQAEDFLQNPAPGAQRPPPASASTLIVNLAAPGEKAGDRIGRYKLLQQIGEGGCGLVYMAEQEEPVRRRVALKVLKLGMDTKSVIARFEAERQALAMMDHPNIAKVLDAGATETGRPYFVMELVRGIKITDYCDEHNLSTNERLELFVQVCYAVQHAHQKGIIHRDLKPSNILVILNEPGAPGCPKVIDFGIAKATSGQQLTDKTVFTAFEQFIGTPAYMSPEQAMMTALDIDTRTDIYSLGVLLYELLTGKTPLDQKELLATGLEEMRRTIREKEPARPSTRLSTMLADELTTAAKHRRTDAPKLVHLLSGDLDWIVMKCLEKDRARRYETASGLANDVQRHLNCEPVVARPPSRLYEFQKTVRRHKFGFAAAGAVSAALLLGLAVSSWLLVKEKAAHKRAVSAEATATDQLWHSYLAQARAARFSGQAGRRFDSLEALSKARAIRFAPELRDEAIACLALPDLKLQRRWEAKFAVLDRTLQRYAVVATNLGNISIRKVSDDREMMLLPNTPGTVLRICPFSHTGGFLAVMCSDHQLRVWDLGRAAVVLSVPCGRHQDGFDFHPDDRTVAVASEGTELSVYELKTGKKVSSFAMPFPNGLVRYDSSGRMLAISDNFQKQIVILDAQSGAMLPALTSGEGFDVVGWHPHEAVLAAPGHDSGLIYVWDVSSGRVLHTLKGHQGQPGHASFSRDGSMLISSGWDGTHLWDARAGEHLLVDPTVYGEFDSFGPADTAYGQSRYGGEALELLSFAPGREAQRWNSAEEDNGHKVLAFDPDGRWLAFGAGDVVKLFDCRRGNLLGVLPTGRTKGVCVRKRGGGLLVSGERGLFLWPVRDGEGEVRIGPPEAVDATGPWQEGCLSENGEVFAAFHGDHVETFAAESLRPIARTALCGKERQYRFLSLSPDGRLLATGGWHDAIIRIWDAGTGALIKQLEDSAWKPDGSPHPAFETSGALGVIDTYQFRIWELDTWRPTMRVPRFDSEYMALSHRCGLLAMRSEQTAIQLVDVATGELLATLRSPIRTLIGEMAFSPDDTQLAVTHTVTRELLVWDLRLLREKLKEMGLDWARPPYPAVSAAPVPEAVPFRVLTNCLPSATPRI